MSALKKAKQATKWAANGLLTSGVIISIGLLSYCGMLAITPSITLAWVAFALAGIIDGQVFMQNIAGGIEDLKLLAKDGKKALLIQALKKRLKHQPANEATSFEHAYYQQQEYVARFDHKKLTAPQKNEKKKAIKLLRDLQQDFVNRVLSNEKNEEADTFIQSFRDELPKIDRKITFIHFSIPVSLGAGIGFGFATAAALDTALIGMTIAASVAIWPLAIIACVGYAFLIYHTISDMISNETLTKYFHKVKQWFERVYDENNIAESNPKFYLRVIGVALLLTFVGTVGILATLATAGTWWLAVKNGAELLSMLAPMANVIRNVLVPLSFATNLIFTIQNSFKSVKKMIKGIQNFHPTEVLHQLNNKRLRLREKETWPQILNPFRLMSNVIALPFTFVIFVGHLAAVGLIGDRTPGLSEGMTQASAVVGGAADAFVDFDYFAHDEHGEEGKGVEIGDEQKHARDHGHDHHHNLISDWVLRVVLSPMLVLSAFWDYSFHKDSANKSLSESLKKSFWFPIEPDYHEKENPKPNFSSALIERILTIRFSKKINNPEYCDEIDHLKQLKQQVIHKINKPDDCIPCQPNLFHHPKLQEFSQKIRDEFPAASLV